MTCWWILLGTALLQSAPETEQVVTVRSLQRSELPNDFPFQVLDVGYAVLEVSLKNASSESMTPKLEQLEISNPKGKALKRAEPTEIVPRLMKYYRGGDLGVNAEVSVGVAGPMSRRAPPPSQPGSGSGSVSVDVGQRLRTILEHYQLKEKPVAAGSSVTGLIYLKSKNSGRRLAGGELSGWSQKAKIE